MRYLLILLLATLTACTTAAPPVVPPVNVVVTPTPVPVVPDPHDGKRPSAAPARVPGPRAAAPRAAVESSGLTDAEKADVARWVGSIMDLRVGKDWAIDNVKKYTTSQAIRDAHYAVLYFYERANGDHYVCLANFLHVGHIGAGAGPPGLNVHFPDQTNAVWLKDAWACVDLYLTHLTNMQNALKAAKAHLTTNTDYQRNLDVATAYVLAARAKVTAMNRTLPYAKPWPPLRESVTAVPFTIQTVVGPHGNYRLTQWDLNRGKNYVSNAQVAILPEYKKTAAGDKIAWLWARETGLRNTLDLSSALLAGVTFTAEQAAEDTFCRVLRVKKMISTGGATAFNDWQASVVPFVPQPWANFVSISGDAWRHALDFANWSMDVFPESTRCSSPFLKD